VKRLAAGALAGTVFLAATPTNAGQDFTEPVVRLAMRQSLAALLAPPPHNLTRYRVYNCFHGRCRFQVIGTAVCRGVARTGEDEAGNYVWITRMACHTRNRGQSPPGGEFAP
jgi:hypothetical protein